MTFLGVSWCLSCFPWGASAVAHWFWWDRASCQAFRCSFIFLWQTSESARLFTSFTRNLLLDAASALGRMAEEGVLAVGARCGGPEHFSEQSLRSETQRDHAWLLYFAGLLERRRISGSRCRADEFFELVVDVVEETPWGADKFPWSSAPRWRRRSCWNSAATGIPNRRGESAGPVYCHHTLFLCCPHPVPQLQHWRKIWAIEEGSHWLELLAVNLLCRAGAHESLQVVGRDLHGENFASNGRAGLFSAAILFYFLLFMGCLDLTRPCLNAFGLLLTLAHSHLRSRTSSTRWNPILLQ